jgi:Flp pilus assembly protein TadB
LYYTKVIIKIPMDDRSKQHQEREAELQRREWEIKLRELEHDIHRQEAPFYPTAKETGVGRASQNENRQIAKTRSLKQDIVTAAKFAGFIVVGFGVVYISQWLVWISAFAILGISGWLWFKYGRR